MTTRDCAPCARKRPRPSARRARRCSTAPRAVRRSIGRSISLSARNFHTRSILTFSFFGAIVIFHMYLLKFFTDRIERRAGKVFGGESGLDGGRGLILGAASCGRPRGGHSARLSRLLQYRGGQLQVSDVKFRML